MEHLLGNHIFPRIRNEIRQRERWGGMGSDGEPWMSDWINRHDNFTLFHSELSVPSQQNKRVTAQLWQTPSVIMKFDDRPPPPSPLFSFFRSLSFFLLPGTSLQASNSSRPRRCLPMIKDLYCVCAQRKLQQRLSLPNLINSLAWPFNDWYTPRPRPHTPSISLFPIFSLFPSVCSARIHEHILTAFR